MSLEQLLEEDIIRFLEGETTNGPQEKGPRQPEFLLHRDWEKIIQQHLKRNNIEAAVRLFNELKQQYNNVPLSHPVEREQMYTTLKTCYLVLVNFLQDRQRTAMLLQHMEQSPDDIFNAHVKPIDLQRAQRGERTEVPELVPITTQNIGNQSKVAQEYNLSLPVAPPELLAATASVVDEKAYMQSTSQRFKDILAQAQVDRAVALQQLAALRNEILVAPISTGLHVALQEKLNLLDTAIKGAVAHSTFEADFTTAYTTLEKHCRAQDPAMQAEYEQLVALAVAFEKQKPSAIGVYTKKLHVLRKQYSLYTEDELLEALTPMFQRMKLARSTKDKRTFLASLDDLSAFAKKLPQSNTRTLLENAAQILRQKVHSSRPRLQPMAAEEQ
jgi:hypothetical protein